MKWIGSVGGRLKAALVLSVILLVALLNNHWERHNIERWDESFSAIYDDRLVPATYVFKLTDQLYRKRLLWNEATRPGEGERVRAELRRHDAAIEALVHEFEATYLVDAESRALTGFKARWQAGRELEQAWLGNATGEVPLVMKTELEQALAQLDQLSRIQEQVGHDLKRDSKSLLASSSILYQLEMALLIIMALLISALVPLPAPLRRSNVQSPHLH
ncbi:Hypothetical protein A7982_01854 [Minicystis rosea]|nr:Hypothetical protein A7982_01854 [Minicystis rosea]